MWPFETLEDFDIFQIDDKTVPKKKQNKKNKTKKLRKYLLLFLFIKCNYEAKKPKLVLLLPLLTYQCCSVRENGLEINSWPFLFLKGVFPWEYYFSRSLLQIIDVLYLFNDGCWEAHRRAIASYTAASKSCTLTHQLLLMKHLEKDLQNQAISLIISCAFFHSVIFSLTSLIFGEIN